MIQTFQPQSKLLQQHIDFFYVFSSERLENLSYIAFPHVNTAISFFKGAVIERNNFDLNIKASHKNKIAIEILGKYTHPVFVNFFGQFEEIAIVFKPLGVSHFFENDMIKISPLFSQALNNELWNSFANELFKAKSIMEKLQLLEIFLLKNYKEINAPQLYKAINYLEDTEVNYAIDKIANLCGLSVKTFQSNFLKHLTCSPVTYKRISRFRHSIQNKLHAKEMKTLTSLLQDTNYYDQSYLIREYKKLTQHNPKRFFDNITALEEKKIVWKVK